MWGAKWHNGINVEGSLDGLIATDYTFQKETSQRMTGMKTIGILFAVALLIAAGIPVVSAEDVSVDTISVGKIDLYNLAVDEAGAGNYADAMTHIDAAIAIDGNFTLAWVTKAGICSAKRDYTGALAAGEMATSLNPNQTEAWVVIADALLNLGRHKNAIEAAETAITLNPDMIESYIILGTAYGRMGEYEKEISVSERALEIDPLDARAQWNLHFAQANTHKNAADQPVIKEKVPYHGTKSVFSVFYQSAILPYVLGALLIGTIGAAYYLIRRHRRDGGK